MEKDSVGGPPSERQRGKMKTYDLISIGTGSAMNIVEAMFHQDPEKKVAVIDKDDPGGICLTRGCIPTKILVYPAEIRRIVEAGQALGVGAQIRKMDFKSVMERMRALVGRDVEEIRKGLSEASNIDYYRDVAEFVAPYQVKVGHETITSKMIFLCLGSRPLVPPIAGLETVAYHTSDTILGIRKLPKTLVILGGGYIAAEYGHFFSAMGSKVVVVGRNPRFLPAEEPEVSDLAKKEMSKFMTVLTNHEVIAVEAAERGKKTIRARDRATGKTMSVVADEMLLALGRVANSDLLQPERGGIKTDDKGWIVVNDYLETSQPNVWALGDAVGKHLFKHVANYESKVVYYNAVLGQQVKADYHAVPHAVFSHPEIASVGLRQKDAVEAYGEDRVLIGFQRFHNTAKGEAMGLKDYFVKVLVEEGTTKILGAHVIGPQASLLIQEIVTLMYTGDMTMRPIVTGMHIHPALSEVVERAFISLMSVQDYEQAMQQGWI
jgi:mycothione reductase